MVVCKCRKATKLYCFVHKVPVCGECICFPEHRICVVRTYSEWVIDGEYDWPPKCCFCQSVLEEDSSIATNRLGCLHVMHTNCLVSHIKSFPSHTAPAGFVCPSCSTPIWPPKFVKDSGSSLHTKLKQTIVSTGLEKSLFGNHPVSLPAPPAFASEPLAALSSTPAVNKNGDHADVYSSTSATEPSRTLVTDIVEIDGTPTNYMKSSSPPGTTTRKGAHHIEKQNSETSYYADDEDGNLKKYSRRGPMRHKFLRAILPFWSSSLPTLPVTAPPRNATGSDAADSRSRSQKHSRMDPRRILLLLAIMACMATMGILYYRIAQRGIGENFMDDAQR